MTKRYVFSLAVRYIFRLMNIISFVAVVIIKGETIGSKIEKIKYTIYKI